MFVKIRIEKKDLALTISVLSVETNTNDPNFWNLLLNNINPSKAT